jgi:hypothetical protein
MGHKREERPVRLRLRRRPAKSQTTRGRPSPASPVRMDRKLAPLTASLQFSPRLQRRRELDLPQSACASFKPSVSDWSGLPGRPQDAAVTRVLRGEKLLEISIEPSNFRAAPCPGTVSTRRGSARSNDSTPCTAVRSLPGVVKYMQPVADRNPPPDNPVVCVPNRLLSSIHDVCPRQEAEVDRPRDLPLDCGGPGMATLVVPNFWDRSLIVRGRGSPRGCGPDRKRAWRSTSMGSRPLNRTAASERARRFTRRVRSAARAQIQETT